MRLPLVVVKLHRWLGLFLGIQVLLWISGGVVMSALSIDSVRGSDRVREAEPPVFSADAPLLSPTAVAARLGLQDFSGASYQWRLDRAVLHLATDAGTVVADAVTGERAPPLDAALARRLAESDYAGEAPVASVSLQQEPAIEIRGAELPLWRVAFADGRHTTLYLAPQTGRIVARRNDLWRVYDVFWMLHIMDYRGRDDFNHPLLVLSAVVAWLLATSGIWLVILWLRRRRRRRLSS